MYTTRTMAHLAVDSCKARVIDMFVAWQNHFTVGWYVCWLTTAFHGWLISLLINSVISQLPHMHAGWDYFTLGCFTFWLTAPFHSWLIRLLVDSILCLVNLLADWQHHFTADWRLRWLTLFHSWLVYLLIDSDHFTVDWHAWWLTTTPFHGRLIGWLTALFHGWLVRLSGAAAIKLESILCHHFKFEYHTQRKASCRPFLFSLILWLTDCPDWNYGSNCTENCTCNRTFSESCDKVSGICLCKPGWNGTMCDNNINECDASPCPDHSTCSDTEGSYHCTCNMGFQSQPDGNCTGECLLESMVLLGGQVGVIWGGGGVVHLFLSDGMYQFFYVHAHACVYINAHTHVLL